MAKIIHPIASRTRFLSNSPQWPAKLLISGVGVACAALCSGDYSPNTIVTKWVSEGRAEKLSLNTPGRASAESFVMLWLRDIILCVSRRLPQGGRKGNRRTSVLAWNIFEYCLRVTIRLRVVLVTACYS